MRRLILQSAGLINLWLIEAIDNCYRSSGWDIVLSVGQDASKMMGGQSVQRFVPIATHNFALIFVAVLLIRLLLSLS